MKKLIFLVLTVIIVSCNKDDNKNEFNESCEQDSNTQTLTHDNEIREYISYIPDLTLILNSQYFINQCSINFIDNMIVLKLIHI